MKWERRDSYKPRERKILLIDGVQPRTVHLDLNDTRYEFPVMKGLPTFQIDRPGRTKDFELVRVEVLTGTAYSKRRLIKLESVLEVGSSNPARLQEFVVSNEISSFRNLIQQEIAFRKMPTFPNRECVLDWIVMQYIRRVPYSPLASYEANEIRMEVVDEALEDELGMRETRAMSKGNIQWEDAEYLASKHDQEVRNIANDFLVVSDQVELAGDTVCAKALRAEALMLEKKFKGVRYENR